VRVLLDTAYLMPAIGVQVKGVPRNTHAYILLLSAIVVHVFSAWLLN